MRLFRFILWSFVVAGSAQAATVHYVQTSVNDADGSTIGAVSSDQYLETALPYSTVTAPESWNSYRFTHWSNDSYPENSYRDAWGRSLNSISFVLLEDTTTTAHYLPSTRDADADSVPDWFEIEYFGDLSHPAAHDSDGDGIPLIAEFAGGTHPLYGNSQVEGGVAWADSGLVTVNLAGFARYTLRSVPLGTVNQSAVVPPGTAVTSPDLSSNPAFGYWTLDGLRQQDAWGVALPRINFTMASVDREAVAQLFSGDSDGDAVPDAYEQYYFGTLDQGGASDSDGDGLSLAAEYAGGTHPLYGNSSQEGGVSWSDSGMVTVNLAGFPRYTLGSVPAGTVNESRIVPNGAVITTPEMTQPTFGYWELDGVRQQDPWGVALRRVTFTVNGADRVCEAHFFAEDSDGDGVNDGFEQYYYGNLDQGAVSDTDGDGVPLLAETTTGTSPVFGNSALEGGVSWTDSAVVVVNLQPYERLAKMLVEGVLAGFFSPDPDVVTGIQAGPWAAAAVTDWDGDGDFDLFVAHEDGLRVFRNIGTPGNPNFQEITSGFEGLAALVTSVNRPSLAGGDWNGDGLGDLILGGNTSTLRLIASSGAFTSDGGGLNLATGSSRSIPALGDMTRDGKTDLIVLLDDGTARFYDHTGLPMPYAAPGTSNFLGVAAPAGMSMATGDVNQDGRLDVLVADVDGRIWEFIDNGTGSFILKSKVWGGSSAGFATGLSLAAVDLENDGDLDLIAGLAHGGLLALRDPGVGRPTGLIAAAGADSIQLDWDANVQSRIRGYFIYRAFEAAGPFARLVSNYLPLPTYLDTAVEPASRYHYYVTGISYFFRPGNSEPRTVESPPSDTVSASAGHVALSLRRVKGKPNNYVKMPLSIENGLGLRAEGMNLQISYDPQVLIPATQADGSKPTVLRTGLSENIQVQDNGSAAQGTLVILGLSGAIEPGSGKLFTLQFKVNENAALGLATSIGISAATIYSLQGHQVAVDFSGSAFVEIDGSHTPGDVDGDGALTEADEDLLKILSKPKAREPSADELAAGDLNGDARLDQRDLVLLKRLLAGLPLDVE